MHAQAANQVWCHRAVAAFVRDKCPLTHKCTFEALPRLKHPSDLEGKFHHRPAWTKTGKGVPRRKFAVCPAMLPKHCRRLTDLSAGARNCSAAGGSPGVTAAPRTGLSGPPPFLCQCGGGWIIRGLVSRRRKASAKLSLVAAPGMNSWRQLAMRIGAPRRFRRSGSVPLS